VVVAGSGCVDVDSGMVVGGGSVVGVDVGVCGDSNICTGGGSVGVGGVSVVVEVGCPGVGVGGGAVVSHVSLPATASLVAVSVLAVVGGMGRCK